MDAWAPRLALLALLLLAGCPHRATPLSDGGPCGWLRLDLGASSTLTSVWGASNYFVVTEDRAGAGIIHSHDGWEWSRAQTPGGLDSSPVVGVHGSAPDDVFAVRGTGEVLHYDGAAWAVAATITTKHLRGVFVRRKADVFAFGQETLAHFDGTAWTKLAPPRGWFLRGAWGRDGVVYAVGWDSAVLAYDGASWQDIGCSGCSYPEAVSGAPDGTVYVASSTAKEGVWRVRGGGCTRLELGDAAPDDRMLAAAWTTADDTTFLVGTRGLVLRRDGEAWTRLDPGVTADLYGVWAASRDDVIAVGQAGTAVRYSCTK